MNNVMTAGVGKIENNQIKMTSREISEMLGLRHDNVKEVLNDLLNPV